MGKIYRIDKNSPSSENSDNKFMSMLYHVNSVRSLPEERIPVAKKFLINKLNYCNFTNATITINFKKRDLSAIFSIQVKPQPCVGDDLFCAWAQADEYKMVPSDSSFVNMMVFDPARFILSEPDLISITRDGLLFKLPEESWDVSSRRMKRNRCTNLHVHIKQDNNVLHGLLVDFSSLSFRVRLSTAADQIFDSLNDDMPVGVVFYKDEDTFFSGDCRILLQDNENDTYYCVLEPLNNQMSRFEPKEFRSTRQELVPQPNLVFHHPLINRKIELKIEDISGTGFSVEEDFDSAVLLPGMIIPNLEICFGNSLQLPCAAQVVYRKYITENDIVSRMRFGLVILDMPIDAHTELSSILHQANNKNSYVCNKVNMEELWNFFFETGFIYPKKYIFLREKIDEIRKTYDRLYLGNVTIAKHFIYQNNGIILGHMSMLRFYSNSWMIHHHAARKTSMVKAGLAVLKQIGRFTFDLHRLNSSHMDYLFCYFRPQNSFPAYVFGGAASNINNIKACSIDQFAFTHYDESSCSQAKLPRGWYLEQCEYEDYELLNEFYDERSGGLMLDALDLKHDKSDSRELENEYRSQGLTLQRDVLSIKKGKETVGIVKINTTDSGINLSDLTNAVTVFIIESDAFDRTVLCEIIEYVFYRYNKRCVPLMIYPLSSAESLGIDYEKSYSLWVLKTEYSDQYFRIISNLLSLTRR